MSVLELNGKCKELGYCDCGGFFGCNDPDHVGPPLRADELAAARNATKNLAMGEGHRKYAANEPLVAMVECEVCDRSHAPNHPHIANIDGDIPIDDAELDDAPEPLADAPARELPEWLKDKPGSQMIRPARGPVVPTCGVCGETWASKHVCKGAEQPELNRPMSKPGHQREQNLCEFCGLVRRSNHNCKGAPGAEKPCTYCVRAGEPCVRHGGERSSVRASRRYEERKKAAQGAQTDERVATELPKPTSVIQPATEPASAAKPELDRELAAIVTILGALDGLTADAMKRALEYVADRKGIKQETQS